MGEGGVGLGGGEVEESAGEGGGFALAGDGLEGFAGGVGQGQAEGG